MSSSDRVRSSLANLLRMRIVDGWSSFGEATLGLRVAIVPLISAGLGFFLLYRVEQVQDLFLESSGILKADVLHWTFFYGCVLFAWVLPIYLSSCWILARYNVLANTSREDSLIAVPDWVCQRLPAALASLCLLAVAAGQFQAAVGAPELTGDRYAAISALKALAPELDPDHLPSMLDVFRLFAGKTSSEVLSLINTMVACYGQTSVIIVGFYILLTVAVLLLFVGRLIRAISSRTVRWLVYAVIAISYLVLAVSLFLLHPQAGSWSDDLVPAHLVHLPAISVLLAWIVWQALAWVQRTSVASQSPRDAYRDWLFRGVLLFSLLAIGALLVTDPLVVARHLYRTPLLAVILGLWVPVLTFVSYYSHRVRVPLIAVSILGLGVLNWVLGDPYSLRVVNNTHVESPSLFTSLQRWAQANDCSLPAQASAQLTVAPVVRGVTAPAISESPLQPQLTKPPCKAPVIVLAAGGASRASFFVTSVLGRLMDENGRSFSNRLFAISGVSGGSVGSAIFQAALADGLLADGGDGGFRPPCRGQAATDGEVPINEKLQARKPATQSWKTCLQELIAGDFLSPTVVSLVFSDLTSFRFWGDRATTLERSWEDHYWMVTGRKTLETPMDQLRKTVLDANEENWLPILLLNGTSVSTGRRIIATDLKFVHSQTGASCDLDTKATSDTTNVKNDCYRLFKDAYDLHELLDSRDGAGSPSPEDACKSCDVRLSTAASLSARFPVVSPHAAVRNADGFIADRIVDGGYFENNGALTAMDLAQTLDKLGLKPMIIQITNEPEVKTNVCAWTSDDLRRPRPDSRISFSVVSSPLGALLETTTARGTLATVDLCRFMDSTPPNLFAPFTVNPLTDVIGAKKLSMSWWLSRNVRAYLDRQVDGGGAPAPDPDAGQAERSHKLNNILSNIDLLAALRREFVGEAPPVAGPAVAAPVIRSRNFEDLAEEYVRTYDAAVLDDQKKADIDWYVKHVLANRERYEAVARATGVPWYVIGILHGMESSFYFNAHLINGDPLTERTRNAPAGRPPTGNPPFTWEESAIDALQLENWSGQTDWSLPQILYRFESYNGFGSRLRFGIRTPYLWSYSDQYVSGKFVADGVWDPNAKSKRVGTAVLLKALEKGNVVQVAR